ncbi:MAG: hypothetical protein A2X42_00180 [Candidatus Margulisbacteria bacterium GWF2_38_17]|nr:MAG: hypothetical protein A2X43_01655 [Candidatus Margulisbacteria bacterium GWD2_39_127]OGI05509.1 MAG: hypothetical protein A2X42_00180 [Candidatus Margulisbacteria bacterium GWF2_38_17]OGI08293.1 MAG: hypothetical protein A2X41_00065 [Candidatus Margulisbacteria bacterium GWE2_39_32]
MEKEQEKSQKFKEKESKTESGAEYLSAYTKEKVTFVDEEEPIVSVERFSATKIGSADDFEKSLADDNFMTDKMDRNGTISLQESLMQENNLQDYKEGDLITGDIISLEKDGVLVDVSYKSEGLIPLSETGITNNKEMEEFFVPGKKLTLKIIKLESKEGFIMLSKKMADFEKGLDEIAKAYENTSPLEAKIENAVRGGLIVTIFGHKGFLPASHIIKEKNENMEALVGKKLEVVVIDFDKTRKKIIVSNKNALKQSAKKESKDNILVTLEAGMVVNGKVSSIKNFGVFVDIGGVEGLIHISELSWCRVNNPEEILKVGQDIDVFVLGVDKEGKKVSLGYKQLFPDPWVSVEETYQIGDIVSGKVSKIVSFGAFIELEKGLEGLIHLSEISEKNITKVEDELQLGDLVKIKILRIIPEEKKIGLSMKSAKNEEIQEDFKNFEQKVIPKHITIGDIVKVEEVKSVDISDEDDKLLEQVMEEAALKKSDLAINMDEVLNL